MVFPFRITPLAIFLNLWRRQEKKFLGRKNIKTSFCGRILWAAKQKSNHGLRKPSSTRWQLSTEERVAKTQNERKELGVWEVGHYNTILKNLQQEYAEIVSWSTLTFSLFFSSPSPAPFFPNNIGTLVVFNHAYTVVCGLLLKWQITSGWNNVLAKTRLFVILSIVP